MDRTPLREVFQDKKSHRRVMGLKVKCPYVDMKPYSCKWIGELNDLTREHLHRCMSEKINCTRENCEKKLTRDTFNHHYTKQCRWRTVSCEHCSDEMVYCMLQMHHYTYCPEIKIPCSNACQRKIPRKSVTQHLQNECPNRLVKCPFADAGCRDKVTAATLRNHLTDNTGKHLTAAYLDQDRKLQELKLEQENKIDALTKELRESKQEKELQKKEQDQKLQETREALESQIELLQKELNERKQEMEILKCDTRQLSLAKQEVDKKIEEQSRCIKQTEQNLSCLVYRLANIPLTFTCSDNLSTASALLSFISKNETPKVFDNFLEFLKQELISDYTVTKNAWSYRKGDCINFIWFVDKFKVRQKQQITNKLTDIKSPRFSTGEKGYFLEVWFDPYGYGESRGTHLSCNLKHDVGPYDDLIIFPHQQQFGVTVIDLRDRQNDALVKQTVEVTKKGTSFKRTHGILSLTKVENVTINDVLILKISVEHWSA